MGEKIKKILSNYLNGIERKKIEHLAVVMFDLAGSTELKLAKGHSEGTQTALEHNFICEHIGKKFDGSVLKHMGDGIFIEFKDPLNACRAALEIKKTMIEDFNFQTKIGISLGSVESLEIEGKRDLLGSTVDRCARLTSLASPNQILIDYAVRTSCETFLKDEGILISDPIHFNAKGIGELIATEISLKPYGISGYGIPHLKLVTDGRMPLYEKMALMTSAKNEIIELGVGLTTFSEYFTIRRSKEFKEKIINLMRKGVILRTVTLNPDSQVAKIYVEENNEQVYIDEIKKSIGRLISIKDFFNSNGLGDNFKIYMYENLPRFHATCIDLKTETGMMSISPYLPYFSHAENPVIQFSYHSNKIMFNKYKLSIETILENAIEIG